MKSMQSLAQRILAMPAPTQARAIAKMKQEGLGPWSFPIPVGVRATRQAELTAAQVEIYSTQIADPEDPRFHLHGLYRIAGGFDLQRLREAMARLVERHGALRTRFVTRDGTIVQESLPADRVDISAKVRRIQDPPQAWTRDEVARAFHLEEPGLWRIRLVSDGADSLLLAVVHHLIADAWSMGRLASELWAQLQGAPRSDSTARATDFVDYARWRGLWVDKDKQARDLDFWRRYLAPATAGWRQAGAQRARQWGLGRKLRQQWPDSLSAALHEEAANAGTTPFLLLLAGFHALLLEIDAQHRWVVASTIADRPSACVEHSLGYFVKTVLSCTPQATGGPGILEKLKDDWAKIRAHDDLALGRVLKELRGEGDALRPAILFVQHNTPEPRTDPTTWSAVPQEQAFARFAWSVRVDARPGHPVKLSFEYDTSKLSEKSVQSAMQAYQAGMQAWLCASVHRVSEGERGWREQLSRALRGLGPAAAHADETAAQGCGFAQEQSSLCGAVELGLAEIWASVLGRAQVGPADNFFALGGDSISSLQVVARALRRGWSLKAQDLAQAASLRELAQRVRASTRESVAAQEIYRSPILHQTAAQRWFFDLGLGNPGYFNQSYLVVSRSGLTMKTILSSFAGLVLRHEALRTRFVSEGDQWRMEHCAVDEKSVVDFLSTRIHHVDQSKLSEAQAQAQLRERSELAMQSQRLDEGGLFQIVYFDRGYGKEGRLLLVMHHLIVDGVSWRLLLAEWELLAQGAALPAHQASPYRNSVGALAKDSGASAPPLKVDADLRAPTGLRIAQLQRRIRATGLAGLEVQARSNRILLAWAQAIAEQQGLQDVVIDLEHHGREHPALGEDAPHCVGWLTQRQSLQIVGAASPGARLPRADWSPGAGSRWQGVNFCFNDHGVAGVDLPESEATSPPGICARPLRLGPEPLAPARDPQDRRPYAWTLNCQQQQGGEVSLNLLYDPQLHRPQTIEGVLDRMQALLGAQLVESRPQAQAPEPSSSTAAPEELDDILEALNQ